MPKVRPNESKEEYIYRAVRYMIKKEGLSPEHARAKAEGMWKQHLKKAGK